MKTRIAACLCVCVCLAGVLQADTRWTGAMDTAWDNPANWTNGVPNATQKAQFVTVGAPVCMLTVTGAEDGMVTLSALGQYVLKLEANDGEYTGSDTVTVNVFNDGCEAAQSLPGYVPIPGDLNSDCIVNDLDLAILQSHWLECNALDCNDVK